MSSSEYPKLRSIGRKALLTKEESDAVDDLLAKLSERAGCRVTYGTVVRALLRGAIDAKDRVIENIPEGEWTAPRHGYEEDVEEFEVRLDEIFRRAIQPPEDS